MVLPIRDADDEMVAQLKAIRKLLGDNTLGQDVDLASVKPPRHALTPGSYVVQETADMEFSDADGTVTLQPGDSLPLVRYDSNADGSVMLLAVGAVDSQDVRYRVEVDDQRTVGGETNSPLGVLNDPFSFVENLGGAVQANRSVAYWAELDSSADAPVTLAARLHVEEVGE